MAKMKAQKKGEQIFDLVCATDMYQEGSAELWDAIKRCARRDTFIPSEEAMGQLLRFSNIAPLFQQFAAQVFVSETKLVEAFCDLTTKIREAVYNWVLESQDVWYRAAGGTGLLR